MKPGPIILSGEAPTEHVVDFDHAPCQWRLQFWSSDVANDRTEAETEKIGIQVENLDDQPLAYHPRVDAKPLTLGPGEKALVFDDSIWELTMVNRSNETEQAILSSVERSGALKLIFEPQLEEGKTYRMDVSLRRAVNLG